MKITVDVPDVDGLPCELWLTLGKTGYEPHCVSFYDTESARTVFDSWWQKKQQEAEPVKTRKKTA